MWNITQCSIFSVDVRICSHCSYHLSFIDIFAKINSLLFWSNLYGHAISMKIHGNTQLPVYNSHWHMWFSENFNTFSFIYERSSDLYQYISIQTCCLVHAALRCMSKKWVNLILTNLIRLYLMQILVLSILRNWFHHCLSPSTSKKVC